MRAEREKKEIQLGAHFHSKIKAIVNDARRRKYQVIIGGDFNDDHAVGKKMTVEMEIRDGEHYVPSQKKDTTNI